MEQPIAFNKILTLSRVSYLEDIDSKKRLIEHMSTLLLIDNPIDELVADEIYERLLAREKLGSTGIGEGVAIPHIRLPKILHPVGALVVLDQDIDYDAPDSKKVDIFFGLLVPEDTIETHLLLLAQLAKLLHQARVRDMLRKAKQVQKLHQIMMDEWQ